MENPQDNPKGLKGCCEWPRTVEELEDCVNQLVKTEPAKAVGVAFVAGLILTVVPVGRILAAIVRLLFLMIRPLLMVLGAMRICEELEKRSSHR